jgi:hypothetical protein
LGHWDLFIDKGKIDTPKLPGFDLEEQRIKTVLRDGTRGQYQVIIKNAWIDDTDYKRLKKLIDRYDPFFEAHAVNTYASTLLMPIDLLRESFKGRALYTWPELYSLAELYDVTITALRVRLQKLGILHIGENGSIRKGKEVESKGQSTLI